MIHYIKLKCRGCTSDTCERKPIGSWCSEWEGCIKEVSALNGDKFFHYVVELKPQLRRLGHEGKLPVDLWIEMEEFLQYIADLPKGERYGTNHI